ncbi:ribonuclease E inhibitor RraB, partial [Neobacillus niacini]|uniref:ribonuclease E inhibitor RraB n=1 Tax=Neobacillus niacini TaxID=86668 RepID=UPI0030034322
MTETINELRQRESRDLETINALKKEGSNFEKEHYLEHYFFLKSESSINKIARRLNNKGYDLYEPQLVEDEENQQELFLFKVGKNCFIQPDKIFETTKYLTELAIKFGGNSSC